MTNVDDPDKVGAMTIEVQPVIESDLGEFGEDSLEIDIDFEKSLNPQETGPYNEGMNSGLFLEAHVTTEKSIVLFEPLPHGIGTQLKNIGYPVHEVVSGVEVMQEVASTATGIVLCGPAGDAEHRRLLTAAIRSRFPELAIVYASTHAQDPRALAAAQTEGAHELLPVPLPPEEELDLFFSRYGNIKKRSPADTVESPALVELPEISPGDSGNNSAPQSHESDAEQSGVSQSAPPMNNQSKAHGIDDVNPVVSEDPDSGEIGSLLKAIAPFLWGLEDAALWMKSLSTEGNEEAAKHARTLHLLNGLLKQLKDRIDAKGL